MRWRKNEMMKMGRERFTNPRYVETRELRTERKGGEDNRETNSATTEIKIHQMKSGKQQESGHKTQFLSIALE